ncbi:MAG TPA: sugar phosphate isomerase/epimerase [Kribbellaceae bacterium]|nr:sugar phosphate isomerase/epimerase [Kribbellaceae bacterium]
MSGLDRRGFFRTGAGVAAGALGAAAATAVEPARPAAADDVNGLGWGRKIPQDGIGMHLYTMRGPLATDYPGSLRQLAGIGYRTIGVSGRFGHSAAAIRGFADDAGLRIVLEHVGYEKIANGWETAMEEVRLMGGRWAAIPSLPGSLRSPDGYRQAAAEFNAAGEIARQYGVGLLYHNHDFDFAVMNGEVLWEILANETDPALVGFELDLYWCVRGKQHPVPYFHRYPGRFPALHVKDMAPNLGFADVGSGVLNWPSFFDPEQVAGIEQWLVEHDSPADPWATARNSYRYLSTMRY